MLLKVYWGKLVILFMQILRASEDYLETMLMMQQQHGYIRSIDVAEHLGVTKPSVTYATKRLRENGYITMDKDGLITLTASGMAIAERMLDRHHTLSVRRPLTPSVPTQRRICDKKGHPIGWSFCMPARRGGHFRVYASNGRRRVKVVPSPSRLSSVTVPW